MEDNPWAEVSAGQISVEVKEEPKSLPVPEPPVEPFVDEEFGEFVTAPGTCDAQQSPLSEPSALAAPLQPVRGDHKYGNLI